MTPAEIRAALEARARRPRGKPRAPKRLPRPAEPDGPERAYTAALRALNRDLVGLVKSFLARPLERAARAERAEAARERQDGPLDGFAGLDFGTLKVRLGRLAERRAGEIAETFAGRIGSWNSREIARVLGINLTREPAEVERALTEWQRENVALITSIAERLHDDVHEVVRDATRRGARVETLAAELTERYGVSESRAELIAQDQTLSFNAELTKIRHKAAGINRYAWSTSRDEKVRPTHRVLEGTIHSWDDPPISESDGTRNHPGQAIRCRCQAIPVLD